MRKRGIDTLETASRIIQNVVNLDNNLHTLHIICGLCSILRLTTNLESPKIYFRN